ncbi:SCO family protein [Ramlibacter sp. G-1-2-2]|uniref:SCO family protein n=1 Tax=Ramlibacter agri TaxID=2728837 RepID=A0A848H0J1_9BURK|nr:SCO family protein [Ramlibacter agri]
MKRRLFLALGSTLTAAACPQDLGTPPPPRAPLQQLPGAALPLALPFTDQDGHARKLGDWFDGRRAVLLVPGYYRCPQLCGLVMHALLAALQQGAVDRRSFRIVRVSVDPQDTPQAARERRALDLAYADFLLGAAPAAAPLDLSLLVGAAAATQALARDIGFDFTALAPSGSDRAGEPARFAHPAAVVVATPDGRVSRYFPGLDFDPVELRVALAEAAGGRIAGISERLALLCAHYSPQAGRHSAAVMDTTRVLGVAGAAALAAWCWKRREGRT